MTSASPSQRNMRAHSARTAVISANSAQAAPQAVKTWTAKAATMREAGAGFAGGSVGSIFRAYTGMQESCASYLLLLVFRYTFVKATSAGQRMAFMDGAKEDMTAEVAVVGGGPAGL